VPRDGRGSHKIRNLGAEKSRPHSHNIKLETTHGSTPKEKYTKLSTDTDTQVRDTTGEIRKGGTRQDNRDRITEAQSADEEYRKS